MANLTFTDLQNEVFAHTGLDSSDATNTTNVKRWINYVQQDLCARWPWPFMEGREAIATVKDYTTGTVSISSGSPTVTGAGTNFTTATTSGTSDQYALQFSGSNDWYKITTVGSTTSITLDQNFQGTANLSAVGYIIRKIFYSLSSSCDRVIDIRNWATPMKIVQVDARTLDDIRPLPQSTNSSYGYLCWGYDTTGNIQVTPYPFPSDTRLLELRTNKRPVDMSAGSDAPSIPNKYSHLLAWGAISIGYAFVRKMDLAAAWSEKLEQRIAGMRQEFRMSEDLQPIMRSIDSVQHTKWINFPDQYPVVTG